MKEEIKDVLAKIYDDIGNIVDEYNKDEVDEIVLSCEIINSLRETANDIELILLNNGINTLLEPNSCAFCGKPTRFPDDKFCCEDCEFDYNEPSKPATKRQASIIKIAPNGDESYHD